MNYFGGLSEESQTMVSYVSYHLFHGFVYKKYKSNTLTKDEAKMLLSAAIANSYYPASRRIDQSLINELEANPLFEEIKEESKDAI